VSLARSTCLNSQVIRLTISWDSVYKAEISNFEELGDEGEVWFVLLMYRACREFQVSPSRFGVEAMEKMVLWALEHIPPSSDPSILEIGSGNGILLHALVEAGFSPNRLQGIDYSPGAVQLAKSIASGRGQITFALCDVSTDDPPVLQHMDRLDSWDVILDKGTFDAIALGDKDEHGRSPAADYPQRVARLLKPGGLFLITCAEPFISASARADLHYSV
jgi:SAM-dependent methyltransferase